MDRVTKANVQNGRRKVRLTSGVRTQVQSTTGERELLKSVHKTSKDDPSQPQPLVRVRRRQAKRGAFSDAQRSQNRETAPRGSLTGRSVQGEAC